MKENTLNAIFILGLFLSTSCASNTEPTSIKDVIQEEVSSEPLVEKTSIIEKANTVWDEVYAKKIIMEELSKNTDWSDINFRDSTTLIHNVQFLPTIKFENKELMLGIAYSDYEDNVCPDCMGVLSAFEFENRGGWKLGNKEIAFAQSKSIGRIRWYKISTDNYAISISNIFGTMGEINQEMSLYAFIMGKISPILGVYLMGNVENYYNYELQRSAEYDAAGYYYLQVAEKEQSEDGDTIVTKTVYAFNGREYMEYHGSNQDQSLESISRLYNLDLFSEREDNVCHTCKGTGIQVCPLCGGTGVNNMGIECGCIRTYNMEKAAGHVPSRPPLRWTCPACGGTGKPS